MKKHLVVSKNTDKGYTLLIRLDPSGSVLDSPTPYVVAWCYNDETDDWLQGHYFETIESAVEFLHRK